MGWGVKRVLVGRALSSHKAEHQLLPKVLALPVFSSDPLSSVAYATEEMMLVLVAAGAIALRYMVPIGLLIGALLAIVVTSYRQTVRAYPRGGGSYIVSRENLGTIPGLVAAAAILTDYVLTVAVSVTAGTVAITSAAPSLASHKVALAVGFIGLLTLANLRGVREAGRAFAIPVYGFVAMVYATLLVGAVECVTGCPVAKSAGLPLEPVTGLALFLLLRAFSSGATALTGVEAIADGVQAFRRPQARNAAQTLAIMGAISISMFLGITMLAATTHVRVTAELAAAKSVLAQIGETVWGRGAPFFLLQAFTAAILVLAANTSYQDFPRLSSILARDGFMPAQFRNRGDRLVFSNGVVVLAVVSALLVVAFQASLTRLIQLYVVGVFTAFTLSQAGMVRRWRRLRSPGWQRSMAINTVGAATTGIVLVIVATTKFRHGAWIVMVAIPFVVAVFLAIHRHYAWVGRALHLGGASTDGSRRTTFVLLVPDLGPATREAVAYLRALRPERVQPVYVGEPSGFDQAAPAWPRVAPRFGELEPLPGLAEGSLPSAVRRFAASLRDDHDAFVTVVVPETLVGRSLIRYAVTGGRGLRLKAALLFEPGVAVCDVPLVTGYEGRGSATTDRPLPPARHVALVPVSAIHDATVRAVAYARSLDASRVEALYFAAEPEETERMLEAWATHRMGIPLSAVDAPFRDLRAPLLDEIHRHLERQDSVVTVVLPEFVVTRWWEHVLHNQTALSIKRLLLFEPRVVVTSVPYLLSPG